jgi:hypothetical protein
MVSPLNSWAGGLAAILGLATGVGVPPVRVADIRCAVPPRPGGLLGAAVRPVVDGDTVIVRLAGGRGLWARHDGVQR